MCPRLPLLAAFLVPCPGIAQLAPRPLDAMPSAPDADANADAFRGVRIAGAQLDAAVDRVLDELTWHERLPDALRAAEQAQKPVVWIQMLGDLDGFT